jgi:hypothetical protein
MTARTPPGYRRYTRRPVVVGLACSLALVAGVTGAVVIDAPGRQQPASAAEVLNLAAATLAANPDPTPRPDQYLFREERTLGGSGAPNWHNWTWSAVDGSRAGKVRSLDESGSMCQPRGPVSRVPPEILRHQDRNSSSLPPGVTLISPPPVDEASSVDETCEENMTSPVYEPSQGLASAPYSVLAELPTDPDALLAALRADPAAHRASPPANLSTEVQIWSMVRDLAPRMPSAQGAALFRAAARLSGIVTYPDAVDAAGRVGIGVGLDDPRLGRVVLIFDRTDHRYLGQMIINTDHDNAVTWRAALLNTAVVDRIGLLPS